MADRYEYYITGDDSANVFFTSSWWAQTFTPSVDHTITSIKLKLGRKGSPGTLTFVIKATDGSGHPTGDDLCSGTTDGNTLPDYTVEYEWREITLGDGAILSADTKYAIIAKALAGDGLNTGVWALELVGGYAGGNAEFSNNSGYGWAAKAYDFMFEEWGEFLLRLSVSNR